MRDNEVEGKLYGEWREAGKEISRLVDKRPDLEMLAEDLDSRKYEHRIEAAWQERFGDLGYVTVDGREER